MPVPMTSAEPVGEFEWSRRAVINAVSVLAEHAGSLTLVGGHAVVLRTADVLAPIESTGDGDLGVTPGLVASSPSLDALLTGAGYELRTASRPGQWGRGPYTDRAGRRTYREKVDLLAGKALSGSAGKQRRGVPALRDRHGKMCVGSATGLELSAYDRSVMTVPDLADPATSVRVNVAGVAALICAKSFKIGERLVDTDRDRLRDKDVGDLWRLMASTSATEVAELFATYELHEAIGESVQTGRGWLALLLADASIRERAYRAFGVSLARATIDDVFDAWRDIFAATTEPLPRPKGLTAS